MKKIKNFISFKKSDLSKEKQEEINRFKKTIQKRNSFAPSPTITRGHQKAKPKLKPQLKASHPGKSRPPKTQSSPSPKTQSSPSQKTQSSLSQKTQSSLSQKTQSSLSQKTQSSPSQKTQSSPSQKTQSSPSQKTQSRPPKTQSRPPKTQSRPPKTQSRPPKTQSRPPKTQSSLPPKTQSSPSQKTQSSPPQKSPSIFDQKKNFHQLNLSPPLADYLLELGFKHPSPVQNQSIKHTLENKNLVCSSPTGSGKTLAFVIPIIEKVIHKKASQVLILTPTREIAIQVENNFKLFSKKYRFTTGLIIGGTDMLMQKKILKEYPNILIATPGRLVDMFSKGLVWLSYTSIVTLDEVDLMLDMGFEKELTIIFKEFTPDVQVLTYTATLPEKIKKLLSKYITQYETVIIGQRMETKKSVEHKFIKLKRSDRLNTLIELISQKKDKKIIVFFKTIDETIKIYQTLRKKKFKNVNCIHSRKSQNQRNEAMQSFARHSAFALLATDIASRGIDVPQIDYVVNYDLPLDPGDYIHRIGRTGRADSYGKAITFFDPKDQRENAKLNQIKKLVQSSDGFQFISHISHI